MVEQRPATQFEKSDPGTPDRPSFLPDLRRICLALPNKDEAAAFLKLLANDKRLRGGSVCLNSFGRFAKWISASIMPPPSLVSAR